MLIIRNGRHAEPGDDTVSTAEDVEIVINGFYVRYGVRPRYTVHETDAQGPHHVEIVDEDFPEHLIRQATGLSLDAALARLADEMERLLHSGPDGSW